MSDFQYVVEDSSLLKSSQEKESTSEAAPRTDPSTVLSAPEGPGQSKVRAQAITQLQRTHGNQHVQRLVSRSAGEENEMEGVAQAVDERRGHGQPLADRTREQMEPALQQDLSGVRVHNDEPANQLSQQFNAKAFTTGQDVFFRKGEYDPGSSSGDSLLAHELTHVVQQGNAPTKLAGKKMNVSEPGDAGEREADSVANAVTSPAGVSRQEDEVQTAAVSRSWEAAPEEESLEPKRVDRALGDEDELAAKRVDRALEDEDELAAKRVDRVAEEEEGEDIVATKAVQRQDELEDEQGGV